MQADRLKRIEPNETLHPEESERHAELAPLPARQLARARGELVAEAHIARGLVSHRARIAPAVALDGRIQAQVFRHLHTRRAQGIPCARCQLPDGLHLPALKSVHADPSEAAQKLEPTWHRSSLDQSLPKTGVHTDMQSKWKQPQRMQRTVMSGHSTSNCGQTPRLRRMAGMASRMDAPLMRASPAVSGIMPVKIEMAVVLPAPLCPASAHVHSLGVLLAASF